ncbi:hypothetical protein F5Y18DRAFT_327863 [Xylariaceae sp. FL1019]|nr:hypothetical protein F5Y18DRAFT_327863 [Xylariaceae sp. FL1019]
MSSMYSTVSPASLHDLREHTNSHQIPHNIDHQSKHSRQGPVTPESNLLSPYSSHARGSTASPTLNSDTPADTISTVEYTEGPFLGAGFDEAYGLEDWGQFVVNPMLGGVNANVTYPLSPNQTPSMPYDQTFVPSKHFTVDVPEPAATVDYAAQQDLFTDSVDSSQSDPQLTPDTNPGSWSSAETPAQGAITMVAQSPRVTVSMWGKEDDDQVQSVDRSFASGAESPSTVRPPHSVAGDLMYETSLGNLSHATRDIHGNWMPNTSTGHRGLAPSERPREEVQSLNQQATHREREEKNREVDNWITEQSGGVTGEQPAFMKTQDNDGGDGIPSAEIPMGNHTVNRHIPDQIYFNVDGQGGPITETDFDLMRQLRTWKDSPSIHAIQSGDKRYQPETSQAAIDRFYRQCQDNASILSKAATWGTRRRSLPSVADVEGVIGGNFLKKLSLGGNNHSRRPSILQRFPSLGRKNSTNQQRKRKGSNASDLPPEEFEHQLDRHESKDSLAPPSRTSSWGLGKKPTPSLNTALVGMATSAASIGTHHARSGSISATPITSPKSPFAALTVPVGKLRRQRSKTDVAAASSNAGLSHPHLVDMLRIQGGPPVARLARSHRSKTTNAFVDEQLKTHSAQNEIEDEDDDDDEAGDEIDFKVAPCRADNIEPTFNGFKAHILRLNPSLDGAENVNGFLVDRIAHQLTGRYKQLLNGKLKHLSHVSNQECPSGTSCLSLGGTVKYPDSRGFERGIDAIPTRAISSDEDMTPLEGGINMESFPTGIPMPPATSLPAEFECQLCFTNKKFNKPSDWTKHVHEDVQPFTCTWDRCREPKMFKRKADWVRHENEGHRHLEWWTCDVEDCRHKCYRRDNFLQHLVREHKFTEPKHKTKAAIKRAGGVDRTWQKVEQCHVETSKKPFEEPCRFCSKTFPTWKKLTVHLAKHMEQISLPVLVLVKNKELEADTIISPVHDPPPRHFGIPPTTPVIKAEPQGFSPQGTHTGTCSNVMNYTTPPNTMGFSPIPQMPVQGQFYQPQSQQYGDMSHQPHNMMMQAQYTPQPSYPVMPVTSAPYAPNPYPMGMTMPETEPFPVFNPLGIQDVTGSMPYTTMGNPTLHAVDQYGSSKGSVSPYSHSPHQGGQFYNS